MTSRSEEPRWGGAWTLFWIFYVAFCATTVVGVVIGILENGSLGGAIFAGGVALLFALAVGFVIALPQPPPRSGPSGPPPQRTPGTPPERT